MPVEQTVSAQARRLAALSFVLFPALLLAGFALHPNVTSFERVTSADQLIASFRHQPGFHYGHLLVMAAAPLIIFTMVYAQRIVEPTPARLWGFWGSVIGIFGAALLAADKGALTLVLSTFDTLSDAEIEQIKPALQAMVDREGLLSMFVLLPCLMVGASLQAIGLWRAQLIAGWQALAIVVGLALVINPDIEIISVAGAILMCLGYAPFGFSLWRGEASKVQQRPKVQ